MIIPINKIVYDSRARNGAWCKLPYPGHPHGCPNFPACPNARPDYTQIEGRQWFAIIEVFDLKEHTRRMKEAHPEWTTQQCRCVLYWQGGVRSRLRKKTQAFAGPDDIILDIPEASGINVFATMARAGIYLDAIRPNKVQKIMLVGKRGRIEDYIPGENDPPRRGE